MGVALKNSESLVFIGAAGGMCSLAIERFAAVSDAHLVLTDINTDGLEALAKTLPAGRTTTKKLDLYDASAVYETIKDAGLVVLGAGPYQRTCEPVLTVCLKAKVPYLDFDDDVESTVQALELHERAKKAGVPCYIGCGASPGITNVLAVDAAKGVDSVSTIDVCWVVGDERPGMGKAVMEHALHIAAGPCLTWKNGQAVVAESWVEAAYAPILEGGRHETLLHETAHPEPVTLPRRFPGASRIRCLGGNDPAPFNGILRGIGDAVRRQLLPMDVAVDFMCRLYNQELSIGGLGDAYSSIGANLRGGNVTLNELIQLLGNASQAVGPWRYALSGLIDIIRTGESNVSEVLRFLLSVVQGTTMPNRGGVMVRVVGTRDGHPTISMVRLPKCGDNARFFRDMASTTGGACAAFMPIHRDSRMPA
ncbi:hypothetical protein CLAIMM_04237 [Cladophialophora immunda]|nr:hypothetical protein CLAIMM_04237 [Cladophialophora immunda]